MARPGVCDDAYVSGLHFFLNGKEMRVRDPDPEMTLLQYVRSQGWTGAKLGCGEGGCGACTLMVSRWDADEKRVRHISVNGCLFPLCAADGYHVTTPQALGSTRAMLSVVQDRIASAHGSQCGFCTPGIAVALHAFLRENPRATAAELEESLDGNLCRCTGYRPILDAAKSLAAGCQSYAHACAAVKPRTTGKIKKPSCRAASSATVYECAPSQGCCGGVSDGSCCMNPKPPPADAEDNDIITHQYIFPPVLKRFQPSPIFIGGELARWIRPLTLQHLLALKNEYQDAKLLNGNTECGIETKILGRRYSTLISPALVPELSILTCDDSTLRIGAAVTLTTLQHYCKKLLGEVAPSKHPLLDTVLTQLRWFAGHQVRNTAAIGGNICTASPISDVNPVWLAADAVFHLASVEGSREVRAREFFLDYRKTALKPNEVLTHVSVRFTREHEYMMGFKQSRRRDDDIAIVTAALRVRLEPKDGAMVVAEAGLGYGGVFKTPVFAEKTEKALVGKEWTRDAILECAKQSLAEDIQLPPNAPGGMVKFRQTLVTSFFFKFFLKVSAAIDAGAVDDAEKSAIEPYSRPLSHGRQVFQMKEGEKAVSIPVRHAAGEKQVTGEALYTDDLPVPNTTLYGAFLKSTKASAAITVDFDKLREYALEFPGVVDVVTSQDIPGENQVGPVFLDEELFAEKEVVYVGQPIAVVLATSHDHAQYAANQLERGDAVTYDTTGREPIITIEQAIEKKSFYNDKIKPERTIDTGGVNEAMEKCDHTLSGEIHIDAQEHFYLETNVTLAQQGEGQEMEIISSSQNPSRTQYVVAKTLGVDANRVVVRVKRMGGGFGGKETRSIFISAATAVASHKMSAPVRMTLDRNVDMLISGTRHPFLYKYKVGFSKEGKISALDITLYGNAGFSLDLSVGVLERGVYHVQNAYAIPHVRATGVLCKTNRASNTAFRGFGGPQAMFACESMVDEIAHFLNKPNHEIQRLNLYKDGDRTHYKMTLKDCYLPRMWGQIMESSQYAERVAKVNEFNAQHRWKKRGIAVIPTMYGMSFTVKFLNQAGALVHLYTDGSVLVSHGGAEMGQGLHTKMAQVAAKALGVPVESVHITETATDKVSNTSPTAASVSSDINGLAIVDACEQLNRRLAPYKEKYPEKSWKELLMAAYLDRVNLSANGFYATPDVASFFFTEGGKPFNYFCYGIAVSEVEIDCLTGDYWIPRADILMDVGESLNPAIDIGQIEGAFVQGTGLFTMEEVVYFRDGRLFTRGPGSYKIPTANDIPVDFRVSLLADARNRRPTPYSSKGVGEPPLFLSSSVLFAIKNAVKAARRDNGIEENFRLDSPATCERIRNACGDPFVEQFKDKYTEW